MTVKLPQGKGLWVHHLARCEGGAPAQISDRARAAGCTHLVIKLADGADTYNDDLVDLIRHLSALGIGVWGAHTLYGDKPRFKGHFQLDYHLAEARRAAKRILGLLDFGLEGYVLEPDPGYERAPGRVRQAAQFMASLRAELPADFPILLAAWKNPAAHPRFPWAEFRRQCDGDMPRVFWMSKRGEAAKQLRAAVSQYAALRPLRPCLPTGPAFFEPHWRPALEDLVTFFNTALELGLPAANLWAWDELPLSADADPLDRAHAQKLWQTLADFVWQAPTALPFWLTTPEPEAEPEPAAHTLAVPPEPEPRLAPEPIAETIPLVTWESSSTAETIIAARVEVESESAPESILLVEELGAPPSETSTPTESDGASRAETLTLPKVELAPEFQPEAPSVEPIEPIAPIEIETSTMGETAPEVLPTPPLLIKTESESASLREGVQHLIAELEFELSNTLEPEIDLAPIIPIEAEEPVEQPLPPEPESSLVTETLLEPEAPLPVDPDWLPDTLSQLQADLDLALPVPVEAEIHPRDIPVEPILPPEPEPSLVTETLLEPEAPLPADPDWLPDTLSQLQADLDLALPVPVTLPPQTEIPTPSLPVEPDQSLLLASPIDLESASLPAFEMELTPMAAPAFEPELEPLVPVTVEAPPSAPAAPSATPVEVAPFIPPLADLDFLALTPPESEIDLAPIIEPAPTAAPPPPPIETPAAAEPMAEPFAMLGDSASHIVQYFFAQLQSLAPEALAGLYAPEAVHVNADRVERDRIAIADFYRQWLARIDGRRLVILSQSGQRQTLTVKWATRDRAERRAQGTDTFHLNRKGQIVYHHTTLRL